MWLYRVFTLFIIPYPTIYTFWYIISKAYIVGSTTCRISYRSNQHYLVKMSTTVCWAIEVKPVLPRMQSLHYDNQYPGIHLMFLFLVQRGHLNTYYAVRIHSLYCTSFDELCWSSRIYKSLSKTVDDIDDDSRHLHISTHSLSSFQKHWLLATFSII